MKKINDTEYTTFSDLWNDPELFSPEAKDRIQFSGAFAKKKISDGGSSAVRYKAFD